MPTTVTAIGSPPSSERIIAGNTIAGQALATPGTASAARQTASGSATTPSGVRAATTMCGLNERIFSRQTSPNPVITASTIMRIATPSVTPSTVITGMADAKLRRGRR